MLLVVHSPGQVVDAADAPRAHPDFAGRLANVHRAGLVREAVTRPAVLGSELREAEDTRQKGHRLPLVSLPQPAAMKSAYLMRGIDRAAVPGRERSSGVCSGFPQRQPQPVRVDDR